jgi:Tfp pilus assembly protein PilN
MIQFNLLPDVKLEYVKAQRSKHLLTVISTLVSIAAVALLIVSIVSVDVVQKKSLSDLNSDIKRYSTQLKSVKDLDKILTVQDQLGTLTTLHDQKPVASRMFAYISQVVPQQVDLDKLTLDYTAGTLTFGGTAPTIDAVSTFTDTLKATTYKTDANTKGHAFSGVVLGSFSRDEKGASFTITCTFDPVIFNSQDAVTLKVPATADADQSSVFGSN